MWPIESIVKLNQYASICREAGRPEHEALDIMTSPRRTDERVVMDWIVEADIADGMKE